MRSSVDLRRGVTVAPTLGRWLTVLVLLSRSAVTLADPPAKETSPWWGHIKVLASNEFQGRLTGSPGYQRAAAYVADKFKQFGLAPAGDNGYFQPVAYVVQTVLPDRSSVSLVSAAGQERLSLGDDLVISINTEQRASLTAPLVFAGYGIHLPEAGYDDFKDLSVKDAVVAVLVGVQRRPAGPRFRRKPAALSGGAGRRRLDCHLQSERPRSSLGTRQGRLGPAGHAARGEGPASLPPADVRSDFQRSGGG